jgi:hypothetical protein
MKRPGWLGGHGSPHDDGEEPGGDVNARAARAREERRRARRRLAAMAAGEEAQPKRSDEEPPATDPAGPKKPDRDRNGKRERAPRGRRGGAALGRGLQATRRRSRGLPGRAGRLAFAALVAVYTIFFDLLGFALRLLFGLALLVVGPARIVLSALAGAVRLAAEWVTPARALSALVAGAAILLLLSQFADYRSVSVGTEEYSEVATVAPAPVKERGETHEAHSWVMVPVALGCLALLGVAVRRRRWRLCRPIAFAGAAVIAVSLLIDRPAGLDRAGLDQAYDGVEAALLGGFYAQLFSGLLLIASSLLLARELRLAEEPGAERSPGRAAKRPAGRPPRAEGARA